MLSNFCREGTGSGVSFSFLDAGKKDKIKRAGADGIGGGGEDVEDVSFNLRDSTLYRPFGASLRFTFLGDGL